MLVWLGYDNNREFTKGFSAVNKNIWADTMEEIQSGIEDNWYETPNDVVGIILDSVTGEVTKDQNRAIMFYYLKGSEPNISKAQIVSKEEQDEGKEWNDHSFYFYTHKTNKLPKTFLFTN